MKKFRYFFKRNNSGSALVIVVGMLSIFIILVTTSLSIASATQRQTSMEYNRSQAYYCASSALDVFYETYNKDTTFKSKIDGITSDTTIMSKNISGMGDVQIVAKKDPVSGNTIVTANSKYGNTTSKASLILNGKVIDPQEPQFNGVQSNSSPNLAGTFVTQGDVVARDTSVNKNTPINITNNSKINGRIYVDGEINFNSNLQVNGYSGKEFYIQATKNITFNNYDQVIPSAQAQKAYINSNGVVYFNNYVIIGSDQKKVDIYANGLEITGKPVLYSNIYIYKKDGISHVNKMNTDENITINGNVFIDGDLNIETPITIDGNLVVTGTLKINAAATITGSIYCGTFIATWAAPPTTNGRDAAAPTTNIYTPNLTGSDYDKSKYLSKIKWNEATDRSKFVLPTKPALLDPEIVFAPYKRPVSYYVNPHLAEMQTVLNKDIKTSGIIADTNDHTINVDDKPIWIKITVSEIGNIKIIHNKDHPDTPVFFYVAPPPSNNFSIKSGKTVMTDTTLNMINSVETFYVDNYNATTKAITKGQPVYWMINESVKEINIDNAMVEGYFYGPNTNLITQVDSRNPIPDVKYSLDGIYTYTVKPTIIGATMVKYASITTTAGTIYLKPRYSGIPVK